MFDGAFALAHAGPHHLAAFLEDDTLEDLAATSAGACFVAEEHVRAVPAGTVALVTRDPLGAFHRVASALYPASLRPGSAVGAQKMHASAAVHAEARLEANVTLDPGAIVGAGAEIGSGTFIGAYSVIGPGVRIGRNCAVDAHVSIANALIGDRVVLHAGVRIGHSEPPSWDAGGKGPSVGRVILQNDVRIGVNAAVERGTICDTVIGEETVIESLVFIEGGRTIDRGTRIQRSGATAERPVS